MNSRQLRRVRFISVSLVWVMIVLGLTGCSSDDSELECGRGLEGDTCQSTDNCDCGLRCVGNVCVSNLDGTDGDTSVDGDIPVDGDTPVDGDIPVDGDTPVDGDKPVDGDTPVDGDVPVDGDIPVDGDDYTDGDQDNTNCQSHDTFGCDLGDVWWFNSCGKPEGKKTECNDCGCSGNACVVVTEFDTVCHSDDVYWVDCHGVRGDKKTECGADGCINGKCNTFVCSNGVCHDPATDFEWQEASDEKNYSGAVTYCADLALNGGGWRLPNISELRTIVDGCSSVEIDGSCAVLDECGPCQVSAGDVCLDFETTPCYVSATCNPSACSDDGGSNDCYWIDGLGGTCGQYWSSSEVTEYPNNAAWTVHFYDGFVYRWATNEYINVRCIR